MSEAGRPYVAAAVFVVAAVLAGFLLEGRPHSAYGRIALGRLPVGVLHDELNLVIVTLDTTRADHSGIHGARDIETPAIDRLGRAGVVFEQAMTGRR